MRITASLKFVLSLLCLGAGHAPIAMAQSGGTFTATANMTTPRSQLDMAGVKGCHSITTLDQRPLVFGACSTKRMSLDKMSH